MNRISEITKRDILNLLKDGFYIDEGFFVKEHYSPYHGLINEIDFLKRLYDLESMPSADPRFSNAEDDIWQHTINNYDYEYCWVFEDDRFQLKNGDDEIYLRFLCEIFHPAVRDESRPWKELLKEINKLLRNDGYELYPAKKISNRDVYCWRPYNPENNIFIPFSLRNQMAIKLKKLKLQIKRNTRYQIYQILERYNYSIREISETGFQYDVLVSEKVFEEISRFYPPKYFNTNNQYVSTNNLADFILANYPYYVFDAIEFFDQYCNDKFQIEINAIFDLNGIPFTLNNGKIESVVDIRLNNNKIASIEEVGLQELLQEARTYYEEGNLKIAVEKLWDAFERLKTYYSPALDKKKSANRIINEMSENKEPYKILFEKEFIELTKIGNDFRIRHHETSKIDIEDERYYEYYYNRCISLINLALQYLDNRILI
jgi:hypothetical protein